MNSLLAFILAFVKLFIAGTQGDNHSAWTVLLLWILRIVSLSLLFRTYVGPSVLRLVSKRLRVRSVSLRSVRGIYFRAGSRTWTIDRIGISFHRLFSSQFSRISIKVEGLKLELSEDGQGSYVPPDAAHGQTHSRTTSPSLAQKVWSLIHSTLSTVYRTIEPTARPIVRAYIVAGLRVVIKALPALTHVVEFELSSARLTHTSIQGAALDVRRARINTEISLSQVESGLRTMETMELQKKHHRRRFSVADLNARLSNSLRRAWDRAWGATRFTACVKLGVEDVIGHAPCTALKDITDSFEVKRFIDVPNIDFTVSLRVDPHKGIEPHSLETSLDLGTVELNIDSIQSMLQKLKTQSTDGPQCPDEPQAVCPTSSLPSSRLAWASPLATKSSFRETLSASMRFRWGTKQSSADKLKCRSHLHHVSILKRARVGITKLTVHHNIHHIGNGASHSYDAVVEGIHLRAGLSYPEGTNLHRQWLGTKAIPSDGLNGDTYSVGVSMGLLTLDRLGQGIVNDQLRVLRVESLGVDILASQWPSPWVQVSPFLSGDPNAQLLVIDVVVGPVQCTERLEFVQELLESTPAKPHVDNGPQFPSVLSPVPRIVLGLQTADLSARLISFTSQGDGAPFALDVQTDGLVINLTSTYHSLTDKTLGQTMHDHLGTRLDFNFTCFLSPLFITVCSGSTASEGSLDSTKYPQDADGASSTVLSMESFQLEGNGNALGDVFDGAYGGVTIDTASIFSEVHCSTEAIAVELWQSDVIRSLSHILAVGQRKQKGGKRKARLMDSLPFGLSVSLAVGRAMVFITSPDLAPGDALSISRGVAGHTGLSFSYCAIHKKHAEGIRGVLHRGQQRLQLLLPAEQIARAVSGTTAPSVGPVRILFQVILWDLALRDAISTAFAADDPYGIEDTDDELRSREHLHVGAIEADFVLSGQRADEKTRSDTKDSCMVQISVGSVRLSLHLAHIYSLLLASRTLGTLFPAKTAHDNVTPKPASALSVQCQVVVKNTQVLWTFPIRSKIFVRIADLQCSVLPEQDVKVQWGDITVAMNMMVKRDNDLKEEWEELAHLHRWEVTVGRNLTRTRCSIVGNGGRLQIPFDYVLADLILDANVTFKSIRHLVSMIAAGQFRQPPSPEIEGPKHLPDIDICVRCFTFEAMDEDLEANLGLIWRAGFDAAHIRGERDNAFQAKVATILRPTSSTSSTSREIDSDYQFTSKHTVSIAEARERLRHVHSVAWKSAFAKAKSFQERRENEVARRCIGTGKKAGLLERDIVSVNRPRSLPPMVRLSFEQLSLSLSLPSFPLDRIPDFLYTEGNGLPRDTKFTLLIPTHVQITSSSLRLSFRDYPVPLLNVPPSSTKAAVVFQFDSDLVIAEEVGTAKSVQWIDCAIVAPDFGVHGASPLSIRVPKTMNPVKLYAHPNIKVTTDGVTDFAWGVSYGPATQDFMRIIDTLSHAPRDSSPAIGFWDKLRLVFHWRVSISFSNDVHLHMKGSSDPYALHKRGAGFALSWKGNPRILIGHSNKEGELLQVLSDTMLVIIPNLEARYDESTAEEQFNWLTPSTEYPDEASNQNSSQYQKICAKLNSGVCFGIGFVLERTCGPECNHCRGDAFHRRCRYFDFRPHYDVKLENKDVKPALKSAEDSYNGFRSDFIHMSISISSGLHPTTNASNPRASSFHLSPEAFAHFWAWWDLFEGNPSLPIRQGPRYPRKRPVSPKFGQHLATLKYRISIPRLFITHVYVDFDRNAWSDGITPFVGVKAMIDMFHADMHQRYQENTVMTPQGEKTVHHKPFYAAEVSMKGLDLRALLAIFPEPLKQSVVVDSSLHGSDYRSRNVFTSVGLASEWYDIDDYIEPSGSPYSEPTLHLLPTVSCPQFNYFKRAKDHLSTSEDHATVSKFGDEDTHVCLLGKGLTVPQEQIALTEFRIEELKQKLFTTSNAAHTHVQVPRTDHPTRSGTTSDDIEKMIDLLKSYVQQLRALDVASTSTTQPGNASYQMPLDTVSADEWADFDNVYQIHCPHVFIDNAIRDLMMQYYHISRSRRGIEYHMATRAVKFIRDQAQAAMAEIIRSDPEEHRSPASSAQAAAIAVRNLILGDSGASRDQKEKSQPDLISDDPLVGWSDGVSLRKGHFCLLLKPQVILRSAENAEAICVLAAVQGTLKTYAIMDDANVDDPACGKVMNRNFVSINGMQTFSPSEENTCGEGYVPLEILLDLRCENSAFDRLVPQTDAIMQYDKFNRLRLRNNVTSVARTGDESEESLDHLQNQTDLVRVHVPRLTVTANDRHFQAISNIVTDLVLFSDAAHKDRSDKLERMLYSYDFTNLASAADVVADMQTRLRHAYRIKEQAECKLRPRDESDRIELFKIVAHVILLAEELNIIFDAIKLAQDKINDQPDKKSALLLHASSEEISWRMLNRRDQLIAKVAIRNSNYYWLSRDDSSTVNDLTVGDIQAFDGAADAEWTEILSKYDEPITHPLVKRKLFLVANWTVLPPVGGITLYEEFQLMFHPMRLQINTRVGRRIMEYVWPARRQRREAVDQTQSIDTSSEFAQALEEASQQSSSTPHRLSPDHVRSRKSLDVHSPTSAPAPRKLAVSRSFTDLRTRAADTLRVPTLHKTTSTDALVPRAGSPSTSRHATFHVKSGEGIKERSTSAQKEIDDATIMKTRASQKTFVWVKVASLNLLLSIAKEDSFLCREARIRTRDLEYRNQTWSFEELVDQFIPSDRNWRGWIKMAFQQPLVPVLPVARELITKTKWFGTGRSSPHHTQESNGSSKSKLLTHKSAEHNTLRKKRKTKPSPATSPALAPSPAPIIVSSPLELQDEPEEESPEGPEEITHNRSRVLSVFRRRHGDSRNSIDSIASTTSSSSSWSNRHKHPTE